MTDPAQWNMEADTPPDGLSGPLQALWWLKKGGLQTGAAWEKAHQICQGHEGEAAHDLVHGLVHLVEGDLFNADYWYRRAGQVRRSEDTQQEWQRIADVLAI